MVRPRRVGWLPGGIAVGGPVASGRLRRAGATARSRPGPPPGAASALPHPRFPGGRSRSRAESRAPSPSRTSPPPPGARAATKTPAAVRSSRTAVADCGGDESSRSGDPARAGASPPPSGLRRRSEAVTGPAPRRRASGPAPPPAAPPAPAATGPAEPALGLGAGGDRVVRGGWSVVDDRSSRPAVETGIGPTGAGPESIADGIHAPASTRCRRHPTGAAPESAAYGLRRRGGFDAYGIPSPNGNRLPG